MCPYNEPEKARALIDAHADQLAAIIVEPILGSMGMLPASTAFLEALRAATARHGIVLVFDEVITGFRVALGGAQERYGVTPDIAVFAKAAAAGFAMSMRSSVLPPLPKTTSWCVSISGSAARLGPPVVRAKVMPAIRHEKGRRVPESVGGVRSQSRVLTQSTNWLR